MRKFALILLAALGPGAPAGAQAPPLFHPDMVGSVWTARVNDDFADRPEQAIPHNMRDERLPISSDDIPADLRSRPFKTRTIFEFLVDYSGRPLRCRTLVPSSEPRLDEIACRKSLNCCYPIRYPAPQRTAPARWVMIVNWEVMTREAFAERRRQWGASPPSYQGPPRYDRRDYFLWPRLGWYDELEIVSSRDIQADYPRQAYGEEGVVSLAYSVNSQWPTLQECEIGISSGNVALDRAACRVARKLELRYTKACNGCMSRTIPLQIVWRKSGSYIRVPLRNPWPPVDPFKASGPAYVAWRQPLDESTSFKRADFAGIADTTIRQPWLKVDLAIDRWGKPQSCDVKGSSGNAEVDRRTCALLLRRSRFTTRTDVFGDPAADQTEEFYVWLGELQ